MIEYWLCWYNWILVNWWSTCLCPYLQSCWHCSNPHQCHLEFPSTRCPSTACSGFNSLFNKISKNICGCKNEVGDLTEMMRYPSGGISNWDLLRQPLEKLNARDLKYFLMSRVLLKGFLPLQQKGRVRSSVASFRDFPLKSLCICKATTMHHSHNNVVLEFIKWGFSFLDTDQSEKSMVNLRSEVAVGAPAVENHI